MSVIPGPLSEHIKHNLIGLPNSLNLILFSLITSSIFFFNVSISIMFFLEIFATKESIISFSFSLGLNLKFLLILL